MAKVVNYYLRKRVYSISFPEQTTLSCFLSVLAYKYLLCYEVIFEYKAVILSMLCTVQFFSVVAHL